MNEALFNRNADACETAKHATCVCHCGGALHGSRHSLAWRRQAWGEIEAQREAERLAERRELDQTQADWLAEKRAEHGSSGA